METAVAVAPVERSRLTTLDQLYLSVYWFATSAHWGAILTVLLQSQVRVMLGREFQGTGIMIVGALGGLVAMLFPPLFGAWSDRLRSRYGRRRPFMLAGVALNVVGLFLLATVWRVQGSSLLGFSLGFWLFALAYTFVDLVNNLASAPYSALIPDMVPQSQRGLASGWLGVMTIVGSLVGILLAGEIVDAKAPPDVYQSQLLLAYGILGALLVIALLLTWFGVRERPSTEISVKPFHYGDFLRGVFTPFHSRNFFWVFFTRLLVTSGTWVVQEFLQPYLRDVIQNFGSLASTAEGATAILLGGMLVVAAISSFIGGALSQKHGRKPMVFAAGYIMAGVAVAFMFTHSYTIALIAGLVFGVGYGAYESVDWALATDVLPSMDDYAKDMGVWHVAQTLPQVLALPVGPVLDRLQSAEAGTGMTNTGYMAVFLVAVVLLLLGTVFVSRVRGVR